MSIAFEWFRYVGVLAIHVSMIDPSSAAVRTLPPMHAAVLRGLASRCSRLSLAILNLASENKHGESIAILGRCVCESSLKLLWLCKTPTDARFTSYLADGLKKDLLFRDVISRKIAERGDTLEVEASMLRSIEDCIASSGLDVASISGAPKLPDLLTICRDLGLGDDFYTGIQRIGSHAVHGTWTDIYLHHLVNVDGQLRPRDRQVSPRAAQLIGVGSIMLRGLAGYLDLLIEDRALASELVAYFETVDGEMQANLDGIGMGYGPNAAKPDEAAQQAVEADSRASS